MPKKKKRKARRWIVTRGVDRRARTVELRIPTTTDEWRQFAAEAVEIQERVIERRDLESSKRQAEEDGKTIRREQLTRGFGIAWDREGMPRWVRNGRPVIGSRRVGGWNMERGGGWR